MKVHNAFHTSLLQPADHLDPLLGQIIPPPPLIQVTHEEDESQHEEYEVDSILDCKIVKKRGRGKAGGLRQTVREYLVRWKGYNEDTWEREASLANAPEALADYHTWYPLVSNSALTTRHA